MISWAPQSKISKVLPTNRFKIQFWLIWAFYSASCSKLGIRIESYSSTTSFAAPLNWELNSCALQHYPWEWHFGLINGATWFKLFETLQCLAILFRSVPQRWQQQQHQQQPVKCIKEQIFVLSTWNYYQVTYVCIFWHAHFGRFKCRSAFQVNWLFHLALDTRQWVTRDPIRCIHRSIDWNMKEKLPW